MYKLTIKEGYSEELEFYFDDYDQMCDFMKKAINSSKVKYREYIVEVVPEKEGEE